MGQAFSPNTDQQPASSPPPIPNAVSFYVAVDGKQTGPFDINTLKQMVSQNKINKEALVWKEGMSNWSAAGEVSEISNIFGSIPPPIPQ